MDEASVPNFLEAIPIELQWIVFHFVDPKTLLLSATVSDTQIALTSELAFIRSVGVGMKW